MVERLTRGVAATPALIPDDWKAAWVHLYHTDRFWFTLATLGAIVIAGAALGFLTDAILKRLGIDLNSRSTGEQ